MTRSSILAGILLLTVAASAGAQEPRTGWDRLLPHIHYFKSLVADPLEPRLSIGLMQTNLFERAGEGAERAPFALPDPQDAAVDVQAAPGIGGSLPLWHLKHWPGRGGIVVAAQLGVFARFRIEYPTREDAGQDWFVGMPVEIAYDRFSTRIRIMHRSSHIGDELVETSGAERIEFGGEYFDFLAAYRFANEARVYGGATYNFRSYTNRLPALQFRGWRDDGELHAGIDGGWYGWANGRVGLVGGVDWQSAQRTNWRSGFAFAAGPEVRTETRASRLVVRYYHGPSTMGEFFLTPETFWALEWVVEF